MELKMAPWEIASSCLALWHEDWKQVPVASIVPKSAAALGITHGQMWAHLIIHLLGVGLVCLELFSSLDRS